MMGIHANGGICSDMGLTTYEEMAKTFKIWREDGTEPGVLFNLYPKLKSNSDLAKVRQLMDFLRKHKVAFSVEIHAVDAKPDEVLTR